MKRVVICYQAMAIGGSTTSLLSILNMIDLDQYSVDLALDFHIGEYLNDIPEGVNLLPPIHRYPNRLNRRIHHVLSPRYMLAKLKSKHIARISNSRRQGQQYLEMLDVDFYRNIEEEYDVAIAFLEGRTCKYVANHVKAKRKIAWIHIDYAASGFDPRWDLPSMSKFDKIITVSDKCKESFDHAFPTLTNRTCVIENILSSKHLQKMAKKEDGCAVNANEINLVTACRIAFSSKGLDRAVDAMARLKQEGLLNNIHWYIIGDGPNRVELERMIARENLGEYITLLGAQKNPYVHLKNMSLFFLPSRWEGKPMAVTEAFMLGLPALVTEYASAREQIRDGVDGMVVPNSTQGIYDGLCYIIEHPEQIAQWETHVKATEYSNEHEMQKVNALIEKGES